MVDLFHFCNNVSAIFTTTHLFVSYSQDIQVVVQETWCLRENNTVGMEKYVFFTSPYYFW
jgi:hypothetical protein